MFVKNYNQVFKSLAVWLPVLATAIYAALEYTTESNLIPVEALPFVVAITSGLGWVIKQHNIKRGRL